MRPFTSQQYTLGTETVCCVPGSVVQKISKWNTIPDGDIAQVKQFFRDAFGICFDRLQPFFQPLDPGCILLNILTSASAPPRFIGLKQVGTRRGAKASNNNPWLSTLILGDGSVFGSSGYTVQVYNQTKLRIAKHSGVTVR